MSDALLPTGAQRAAPHGPGPKVVVADAARTDSRLSVAIDIGGTSVKGALVAADGSTSGRSRVPTPANGCLDGLVETVVEMASRLRSSSPAPVVGVGVAIPGLVDTRSGVVRFAGNLGLEDAPLRSMVRDRMDLDVILEQDGRAAGFAELHAGGAAGQDDALVVCLGTGVAAGIISGGRVLGGATMRAGELGHVPVVRDGELCGCGMRGCAEAYVSGLALPRRYREGGGVAATAEDVFAAARAGDTLAQRVIGDAIYALSAALVGYIVTFDPAVILVGGGLSEAGDALMAPLRDSVASALSWREAPPLVAARFGAECALIGAGLLALHASSVWAGGSSGVGR